MLFSARCFWDRDRSKLDLEKSKNYIITRVLDTGNLDDLRILFDYYGWDTIKEEIVKIKYMNKKLFNWLSSLFEINPEDFRCYNNRGAF